MPTYDLHRPQYHFLPEANWLNDPNGLMQWQGQYHLFYQHNPEGAYHGNIHWGHAASADLVHWQHLPIALAPSPDGPDRDGVWSGCAVNNHGVPTLLYTGVFPQTQCLAWSDDDLLTWHKLPQPLIAAPPADLDIVGGEYPDWRDPWVWCDSDRWYMLIGSGIHNVGGTALLYESSDLLQWTYLHPILIGDSSTADEVWECPNLFPLGDRHVLLISTLPEFRHTYYLTGDYAQQRFHPAIRGKVDHGAYFYAAQTMRDETGRRLMWGWIKEGRSREAQLAAGWSGVMSLPRVLDLRPDGTLGMNVAPELKALRGQHFHWEDLSLSSYSAETAPGIQGRCLEISAEFELIDAEKFGFWIHCSPNGDERTLIACDVAQQSLIIDRQRSSLDPAADKSMETAPLPLAAGETLGLQIYVDHSVVEVFAGNQVCLTSRVYPTRSDSSGVRPFAIGSRVRLKSLDLWTMKAIEFTQWTSTSG
jgi:beta-fructofuranosidase